MKPIKKAADMTVEELAAYIDHSVLKPEFTQEEIIKHSETGVRYGCKSVCINPASIDLVKPLLKGTRTGLCVVCDFPFGLSETASKVAQAKMILDKGDVMDLDMVSNYGWIRSGLWTRVQDDIAAVAEICHSYGTVLKVIFETDALTPEQIAKATECAVAAQADYVKTSTGFFTGGKSEGATYETMQLMMDTAAGRCKTKASGNIRNREKFLTLIDMGVDRLGIGYKSTPIVLGLE